MSRKTPATDEAKYCVLAQKMALEMHVTSGMQRLIKR